jgi:hypothetical protein
MADCEKGTAIRAGERVEVPPELADEALALLRPSSEEICRLTNQLDDIAIAGPAPRSHRRFWLQVRRRSTFRRSPDRRRGDKESALADLAELKSCTPAAQRVETKGDRSVVVQIRIE